MDDGRRRRLLRVTAVVLVLGPLLGLVLDRVLGRTLERERAQDLQVGLRLEFFDLHRRYVRAQLELHGAGGAESAMQTVWGVDRWGMPWRGRSAYSDAYSTGPNRVDEGGGGDDVPVDFRGLPRSWLELRGAGSSWVATWVVTLCLTGIALAAAAPAPSRARAAVLAVAFGLPLAVGTGLLAVRIQAGLQADPPAWAGEAGVFLSGFGGALLAAFALRRALDQRPPGG